MKRSRFTEEQIIGVLKEHEAGAKTANLSATCDRLRNPDQLRPRRFSKVWDHAANKRKALFLSSWNCSIARVGEGETDFNILSAKPIREKMFRGASSLRFV